MKLSPYCDLVFLNGNVVTVDARFSLAQAVAISGNRIAAVGSDDQVRPLIGNKTAVVDLKGRTVLPGINDSHSHTALWAGTRPTLCSRPCLSQSAVREGHRRAGRSEGGDDATGEWVRGIGWDAGYLEECSLTPVSACTRRMLDAVSPDNPVALTDFSVHSVWVNSRALELAGIGRDTVVPIGGGMRRTRDG